MDQRGRPRTSSRALLEEAATELFLEQGYTQTTIDQISSRAGVSRATFFNYFDSKSDVLWLEVDLALAEFEACIRSGMSLATALAVICDHMATGYPPLISSHADVMDAPDGLSADAGRRVVELSRVLSGAGIDPARIWLVTGVIVQAALDWANAGATRDHPRVYLEGHRALAPEVMS